MVPIRPRRQARQLDRVRLCMLEHCVSKPERAKWQIVPKISFIIWYKRLAFRGVLRTQMR